MAFAGIEEPDEFRQVTRAHLITWRSTLETRELAPATMNALSDAVSGAGYQVGDENWS